MSKSKIKLLSALLSAVLTVSLLGGCAQPNNPTPTGTTPAASQQEESKAAEKTTEAESKAEEATGEAESQEEKKTEEDTKAEDTKEPDGTILSVGYDEFTEKFSPFFATTTYDQDAQGITQIGLTGNARGSEMIYKGGDGDGEVIPYQDKEYTYPTLASLDVEPSEEKDENGVPKFTTYTYKMRDNVKFSDGKPVTVDDAIFSFYVYCDPTYSGSSTLSSINIVGLQEYRTQTNTGLFNKYKDLWDAAVKAGPTTEDAEQKKVWEAITKAAKENAPKIADAVGEPTDEYAKKAFGDDTKLTGEEIKKDEGLHAAYAMVMWNLASFKDGKLTATGKDEKGEEVKLEFNLDDKKPTMEDIYNVGRILYGSNDKDFIENEMSGKNGILEITDVRDAFIKESGDADPEAGEAKGVKSIEGLKRIDDHTFSVTVNGVDAAAVYKLGITVSPLHYYGDPAKYDYEAGKYGFDFKDLSKIKEKNKVPLGAGPYVFEKFEKKVIYYTANENYWLGAPKIKHLQFKTTPGKDKVIGVEQGIIDITDPSFSKERAEEIKSKNSNKELVGDMITTSLVDNLGYGYIGISAKNVKVGEDSGSEESKALRLAFATVFAEERALAVDSFYGAAASVIQYPISNTSWAAPKPGDEGYQVAYSQDVEGNPIYTDEMDEKAKRKAAQEAAIGYLKKAGYTFDEGTGKFTAAPEGASLVYTIIVPGEGTGDHPSFKLITEAKKIFEEIGITLDINDPANPAELWDTLDAGTQEMWCAAWNATIDPDMYQIYHSSSILGAGGTNNNHYGIADEELDKLIMDARVSFDQEYRKSVYKRCLDIIMEWGVEIPIYQRQNCIIFSTKRVNMDTVTPDITTFYGWSAEVEKMELK